MHILFNKIGTGIKNPFFLVTVDSPLTWWRSVLATTAFAAQTTKEDSEVGPEACVQGISVRCFLWKQSTWSIVFTGRTPVTVPWRRLLSTRGISIQPFLFALEMIIPALPGREKIANRILFKRAVILRSVGLYIKASKWSIHSVMP